MLSTFMHSRKLHRRPDDLPTAQRVRLLSWPMHLRPNCYELGTVEGMIGDELLVRFGEIVMQVPPEMVEWVPR